MSGRVKALVSDRPVQKKKIVDLQIENNNIYFWHVLLCIIILRRPVIIYSSL
jgi:hypothetical protein